MAGKKPAKLATDAKKIKKLIGEKVLYVGLGKGVVNVCPQCESETSRGMVSRYDNKFFCSEICVKKAASVGA